MVNRRFRIVRIYRPVVCTDRNRRRYCLPSQIGTSYPRKELRLDFRKTIYHTLRSWLKRKIKPGHWNYPGKKTISVEGIIRIRDRQLVKPPDLTDEDCKELGEKLYEFLRGRKPK